jgi:hypothetical protein
LFAAEAALEKFIFPENERGSPRTDFLLTPPDRALSFAKIVMPKSGIRLKRLSMVVAGVAIRFSISLGSIAENIT